MTHKTKVGSFKARDKSYSPYHGTGTKHGPCRDRGHIFMGGHPNNHGIHVERTCRRCGIEEGPS